MAAIARARDARYSYETAAPVVLPSRAEYAQMLARSDPLWIFNGSSNQYPSIWTEAPFVGNGMVGAYVTVTRESITVEVSRHDYWDVRLPGTKYVRLVRPRVEIRTAGCRV